MTFNYCLVLALLPCAAIAAPNTPDAASANARVAPASYTSAFEHYRSTDTAPTSPDRTWLAANTQVQREGNDPHAGMDMTMPAANGQQAKAKADPHAGHDMDKGMNMHKGMDMDMHKGMNMDKGMDMDMHKDMNMNAPATDGQKAKTETKADPHAGHDMHKGMNMNMATPATDGQKAKTDPHAGHEGHQ
jgi:hypothetical protein